MRDFKFERVSDLTARLSILLKHATLGNQKLREIENEQAKRLINEKTIFEPKIEDPLDVIEIFEASRFFIQSLKLMVVAEDFHICFLYINIIITH